MEKLKKFIPDKIQITGHKAIVSDRLFDAIIGTINSEIECVNQLIDFVTGIEARLDNTDKELVSLKDSMSSLQNSTKALANALLVYNNSED